MGLIHSPASIVTDGLALHLDAANPRGYNDTNNLLRYSEQFDNPVWAYSSYGTLATAQASDLVAPDGTPTADLVTFAPDGTGQSRRTQLYTNLISGTYTASVYVKKGTLSFIGWYLTTNQVPYSNVTYNFDTDSISGAGTFTRTLLPNGWVRLTSTYEITTHDAGVGFIATSNGTVYAWGAQLEYGSTATTYTKTEGTAITKALYDLSGTTNFTVNGATYDSASRSLVFTRTMPPTTPETGAFANVTTTGNLTAENYLLNDHTTEVWFKPNNRNPTGYGAAFDETVSNIIVFTGYHSGLYYSATQYTYSIWTGNYSNAVNYTLSFNNNTVASWTQLVAVRSGNTLRLYMNGVEQTSGTIITSTASGTTSDSNLSIARANISSQAYSWHADMNFASLRMYKRALSATEVAQNFAAYRRRFGL